ncbi:MAG: hypothetical protein AAFQ23_00075 [Cyanobacteria bacterium J06623_1]
MWITFKLSEHHGQIYRNIADELSEHRGRTIGTSKTVRHGISATNYRNIEDGLSEHRGQKASIYRYKSNG